MDKGFKNFCLDVLYVIGVMVTAWIILRGVGTLIGMYVPKAQAVDMTASVSENICNSNLDILRECCK